MNKRQKKKKYTMCLKTIRKAIHKYYKPRINIDPKAMNYRYFKYSDYVAEMIKHYKLFKYRNFFFKYRKFNDYRKTYDRNRVE